MTFHVARTSFRPYWLAADSTLGLAGSDDASPVLRVVTAASSRFRLRLGVLARDRPAAPKQSADWGTTGGPVTTGPILPSWWIGHLS
jgi:hypothetical protein